MPFRSTVSATRTSISLRPSRAASGCSAGAVMDAGGRVAACGPAAASVGLPYNEGRIPYYIRIGCRPY